MPAPSSTPSRVAAAASVLFGVSFFLTVASVNVPHQANDAELVSWWQDSGHLTSGLVSMFFAMATAVLFAVVLNHLLLRTGDRSPHLAAFARSTGAAFTAILLVCAGLRAVIGHLVQVQDQPLPGVDVLRYATAANYTMLSVVVMGMLSLTFLALGALVIRTRFLPRWAAGVSLFCGVVQLGAVFAMFGAYTVPVAILWSLCTAIAIWRRTGGTPSLANTGQAERESVGTMTT